MKTLITLACCLFVWSQVAFGHAVLVATSPAAGAVLAQAPQEIVLRFDEPIQATTLRLFDPSGHVLNIGVQADENNGLRLALPRSTAGAGTYVLNWRVLSRDGHPVRGLLEYSIGTISQPPASVLAQTSVARDAAIWLTRWLIYLCLFAVGGAALFHIRFRNCEQGWVRLPAILGLVLLLVDLALWGMELLDVPWTALFGMAPWRVALSSAHALTLGLMALGFLAGLVSLRVTRTGLLWLWALASVLLPGVALAVGGQVAGAYSWVARPLVVLHVLIAMIWVGTLLPLYRLLHAQVPARPDARRPSERWPGLALNPFAWVLLVALPLILSGLVLGFLRLGRVSGLLHTNYGNVLLATLILAVVLFFVAVRNRWRLAAPELRESFQARARARRGLGTELILAAGLLSVVSLWHFAPPPHDQAVVNEPSGPIVALENRAVRALVELPRLAAGPWRIEVISIDGVPLNPQRVVLTLGNPGAGVEPVEYVALRQPDGRWRVDLPALSAAGQWHVQVDVWVGDFKQVTLQGTVTLPKGPAPLGAPVGRP
ncbi:copper resistance protein CopC [Castellaniella sp.]|uniref:copper resistance CopC/CopD family protein n=1 Tax=Castellaniella sp. TaxID=1955812 RepID=UPI0025C3CD51|nr:copper resistance protein CopC [Castellaniella sp.]